MGLSVKLNVSKQEAELNFCHSRDHKYFKHKNSNNDNYNNSSEEEEDCDHNNVNNSCDNHQK